MSVFPSPGPPILGAVSSTSSPVVLEEPSSSPKLPGSSRSAQDDRVSGSQVSHPLPDLAPCDPHPAHTTPLLPSPGLGLAPSTSDLIPRDPHPSHTVPLLPSPSELRATSDPLDYDKPHATAILAPFPTAPAAAAHLQTEPTPREQIIEQKKEMAMAIKQTPNDVLERQLERVLITRREEKGEPAASTLVPGLMDSEVWTLRRRFDVQVNHVLSPPVNLPSGQPDLRSSSLPGVPYNTNILKSNVERVFGTLVFKGFIFAREMRRIQLWTKPERPRTAAFCVAYIILWAAGLLIPGLTSFLILLIVVPRSRLLFFPDAQPKVGIPVPQTTPTWQSSFLLSVPDPALYEDKVQLLEDYLQEGLKIAQRFSVRVASGGYTAGDEGNGLVRRKRQFVPASEGGDGSKEEVRAPEHEEFAANQKDGTIVEGPAQEKVEELEQDKKEWSNEERDVIASKLAKSVQDLLGKVADACEILQNALTPPAPFPRHDARKSLAALLAPIVVVVPLLPAWFWSYAFGALFGLLFFGQPLLARALDEFVRLVPNWKEKLHLRDSIFYGVPTNMQLALHVLRIKESCHHPLPPPPSLLSDADVKQSLEESDPDPAALEISDAEAGVVIEENEEVELQENKDQEEEENEDGPKKKGFKAKMARAAQRIVGSEGTLGQTRQKAGEKIDLKYFHSKAPDDGSNSAFPCQYRGISGHIHIHFSPFAPATLTFDPIRFTTETIKPSTFVESLSFPLEDLVELKKLGVNVKRALLGKAANLDLEGKGLEMRFKNAEERRADSYGRGAEPHEEDNEGTIATFLSVTRRDELFARLVSIPLSTRWESL